MKLNEAQQTELRFLRNRVDEAERDALRRDAPPNANIVLWAARNTLKTFVEGLRKEGYDI